MEVVIKKLINMKLQTYIVHYIDRKGQRQEYVNKCCLCIDGAEEAFKLDVKGNCKEIIKIVRVA